MRRSLSGRPVSASASRESFPYTRRLLTTLIWSSVAACVVPSSTICANCAARLRASAKRIRASLQQIAVRLRARQRREKRDEGGGMRDEERRQEAGAGSRKDE